MAIKNSDVKLAEKAYEEGEPPKKIEKKLHDRQGLSNDESKEILTYVKKTTPSDHIRPNRKNSGWLLIAIIMALIIIALLYFSGTLSVDSVTNILSNK